RMFLFYRPFLKRVAYPFFLIHDIFRFLVRARDGNVRIIQLNPSLIIVPMLRDGLVLMLNRLFVRKKTVVVFHGWRPGFLEAVKRRKALFFLVSKFFSFSDRIFVLSEKFKGDLLDFGVDGSRIRVTTTFFSLEKIDRQLSDS